MDEDALSKLAQFIIEHLSVKYVLQDRFHVAHCVSKWFNNSDPRFHYYVIVGWRHHTVTRRAKQEALVDAMLRRGEISKSRKGYAPIVQGTPLSDDEIQALKDSGAYHDFFSTRPVVVPEYVMDRATLIRTTEIWEKYVGDAAFNPPDAQTGERTPIYSAGKHQLIASLALLHKVKKNALKRIVNCVVPPELDGWRETGEVDHNGLPIWQSLYHSCGVESINAGHKDMALSSTCEKELATGCFLQGNAKRIVSKMVQLNELEDTGTWDLRCAQRINYWAGYGGNENMIKLLAAPPLAVPELAARSDKEVVIQPLGRLDSRVSHPIATEQQLAALPNAPTAIALLPPQTLLAFPALRSITTSPAALLMERREEELDPDQQDSPYTRRTL